MTDEELIAYYVNLLPIQYKKDKAEGHIESIIKPIIIFEFIDSIKNGYNIDTAVGVQLDVLGEYIGLNRNLSDGTIVTQKNDTDYRNLLKFKIIKNFTDHSNNSIDNMLYNFFSTTVKHIDNFDMSATYIVFDDLTLAKTLKYNDLFPRGMGVRLDVIESPDPPFAFLGTTRGAGFGKLLEEPLTFSDGVAVTFSDGEIIGMLVLDESHVDGLGGKFSALII